ncbi:MAG: hypothetical protein AB8F26_10650 [Phycisphaerales bacterium]
MTESPAPTTTDTPTPHTIRTDRPCAKCGFNLFGQSIVREPHYNLTAARCPECGQLAALQEYPALGKWADRWARLIAAIWILFVIAAMFAHFGPTLGLSFAAAENAREDIALSIAASYQAHLQTQVEGPIEQPQFGIGTYNQVDADWFNTNSAEIIAAAGGRRAAINSETVSIWFPLALITFAFGAFWSTALLGAKRPVAFVVACIPPAVALTFVFFITATRYYDPSVLIARDAATQFIRPIILPMNAAVILMSLALGIFLGRKLARLLVRLALPPRMRSALAILWTCDNLPPPTTAR